MNIRIVLLSLFVLLLAVPLLAACRLSEEKVGDVPVVVLENDLLRLTFNPTLGGQCTGIAVQREGKWQDDFSSNLFDDMDWNRMYNDQVFSKVPYAVQVLEQSPGALRVSFEKRGVQEYGYIVIKKTVTLRDGERAARVDYEIRNLAESMQSKTFKLWLHNGFFPKSLKGTYYWSSPGGIHAITFPGDMNNWEERTPRGWTGVVNDPPSSGVACVMDYKDVQSLYDWLAPNMANIEWRYLPQLIPCGESYKTTVWLLPFAGLSQIDHASPLGVYAWQTGDQPALQVAATRAGTLAVTVQFRPTLEKTWKDLVTKDVPAAPAQVATLPFALPQLADGRYVVRAVVKTADGGRDDFEKVFAVGKADDKGEYTYAPVEAKAKHAEVKNYAPFKLSEEFVTPHVPWFTPYAKGKVKALFITHWGMARPVIELAERCSVDYTVPALGKPGPELFFTGSLPPLDSAFSEDDKAYLSGFEKELTEKHDYEVVVVNYPWDALTAKTRDTIMGMLEQGAGLMISEQYANSAPDLSALTTKVRQQSAGLKLPGGTYWRANYTYTPTKAIEAPDQPRETLSELKTGGRVCLFNGDIYTHGFCQSLLWAAHREPESTVAFDGPAPRLTTRAGLVADSCTVKITTPTAVAGARAELVISQNNVSRWQQSQPVTLNAGDNTIRFAPALLPVGKYDCQVMVKQNGQVLNSALMAIELTDPVKIAKVRLVREVLTPGEPVAGTATFGNDGREPVTRAYRVECVDRWGRTIARQTGTVAIPAGGSNEAAFLLEAPRPLAVSNQVVVTLADGAQTVARQSTEVTFPALNAQDNDYLAFTWPDPGSCWGREYADKIMVDYCGFNLCMAVYANRPRPAYEKFFDLGGMGAAYNDWQVAEGRGVRQYSLTDPKTRKDLIDGYVTMAKEAARYGIFAFDAADEPSLTHWETPSNVDFSPSSMAGFAVWIKKQYPTLDALNAEWGTTFTRWEDVSPMIESEVQTRDNLAPWNDFRAYMEDEWTDFFREVRNTVRAENPKALFGVCGIQDGHPYSGFDWWKQHEVFDYVLPYTNCAVIRSFTPTGKYGRYTGYRIAPAQQIKDNWADFFDGQYVFSYFLGTYPVAGDLSIAHTYADPIREITQRFGQGIGKLFIDTKRQNDRIAIHYSQPSIRMNYMQKFHEKEVPDVLGHYRSSRLDFEAVLHDLGYDFNYLAYGQIEQGELTPANYRMLILPHSTALSAQETAAIRKYVADGGIVLADYLVGLFDDHGKPNAGGSLDDLFGIKRAQTGRDRLTYLSCTLRELGKSALFCRETGITAAGAQPLYTSEVGSFALLNTTGKGKTVYLDFTSDYLRNVAQQPLVAGIFRTIFARAGLPAPVLPVRDSAGQPALCQVLRHAAPESKSFIFGLLQRESTPNDGKPLQVALPAPLHVYDMLTGAYQGKMNTLSAVVQPGYGRLFAALPYQVTGVTVTAPKTLTAGKDFELRLQVNAKGGAPEYHILRLTITAPDGTEAKCYTKNLPAPHGTYRLTLPLALDAPAGVWKIRVKDASTGVTGTAQMQVK